MKIKSLLKPAIFLSLIFTIVLFSYAFTNYSNPTVSVSVSKMNVLYLGVDNPVVVAIAGVPSEETSVESDELEIEVKEAGHYILRGKKPGSAILKVKANGQIIQEERFRVKRIPDPVARVNTSKGGLIPAAELKASQGVHAYIECFNFDARCSITGYDVIRIRENADPLHSANRGAKHETLTRQIINKVKVGDTVYFEKIKCKCPGDRAARGLNSLVFQIR